MSAGELIGLIITVGLLCGAITAFVIVILTVKQSHSGSPRPELLDACERWLGAKFTLSRVSLSFVMAFRSLAKESKESPYHSLRTQEAQRTREQWSQAKTKYERTLAAVIVRSRDPNIAATFKSMDIVNAGDLRQAINGSPVAVQRLRHHLNQQEQNAIRWVQQINGYSKSPFDQLLRPLRFLQNIVKHW